MTKKDIKNYFIEDYLFNLDQAAEWYTTWVKSTEPLHTSTHRIYKSYYHKAEHDLDIMSDLKILSDDEWDFYFDLMQTTIYKV